MEYKGLKSYKIGSVEYTPTKPCEAYGGIKNCNNPSQYWLTPHSFIGNLNMPVRLCKFHLNKLRKEHGK